MVHLGMVKPASELAATTVEAVDMEVAKADCLVEKRVGKEAVASGVAMALAVVAAALAAGTEVGTRWAVAVALVTVVAVAGEEVVAG